MFKQIAGAAVVLTMLCGCFCGREAAPAPAPAKAPAKVAVKAPAPAKVAVKKAAAKSAKVTVKAPALENPQSWTLVMIPDIQTYVKQMENNGILDMMLAWIVRRRAEMNIQQVVFTGDLVYSNDRREVLRTFDYISDEQWKVTSRLLERLDGQLPYVLCTGNHDYGITSAQNRNTWFNKYFPTDRNPLTRRQLVACAPNTFGVTTLETSLYEFQAPHPDNRKFFIITLPFAPTDDDLKWALKYANSPRFANHVGIILTHSYILGNGKRLEKENYVLNKLGGNPGEAIFKKLIYPAKNIRLVLCGHVCRPDSWPHAVGFSTDKNHIGKSVSQLVFNTQAIGGGWHGSGGDGWLRLLEFMPDGKTIKARTFSPYFYRSPSTRHLSWKTDAANCFSFEIEK